MLIRSLFMGLLLVLLSTAPHAQQATEIYIPIGASPGVSNTSSIIGTIATVSATDNALTVTDAAGTVTVSIPKETPIWLDRSAAAGTNEVGSPADLEAGLTVEVKYREAARAASVTADWIKVQMTD
ncbi:MAG: hypothetical protein ACREWE_11630 [Gammaproteobacteria bacterium]